MIWLVNKYYQDFVTNDKNELGYQLRSIGTHRFNTKEEGTAFLSGICNGHDNDVREVRDSDGNLKAVFHMDNNNIHRICWRLESYEKVEENKSEK